MRDGIIVIKPDIHSQFNDDSLNPIIDMIDKNSDVKTVVYPHFTEYKMSWYINYLNYGQEFKVDDLFIKFGKLLEQRGVQFYLIVGSEYNEVFENFYKYPIPNFHIIYWPTFLVLQPYINFLRVYPNKEYRINKVFEHLFISYNNKSRYHRSEMIDELCKRDLLKDNLYSWIETSKQSHGWERLGIYEFDCFDDINKRIDNFDEGNKEFSVNLFDMNCFINIVTESDIDALFITEKTYRQLLIGQPFLSLSAKHIHKTLKSYGFELYDEIFDYSFDDESDYKKRIKGIIDNVERLNGQDYYELYKKIEPKVEHNVRWCYKLLNESYLTPQFIIDFTKKYGSKNNDECSMELCEYVMIYFNSEHF